MDNKPNLLYEARFASGVNAHDSGMLAFEGKRLAIMEELSATRTLDTSLMKQLTGGETHVSVRAAGSANTRAMEWSAKLITVFNEGCAPRFKVEDDAFTKRMIVVPHRALLCKDPTAREAHGGEPFTYDADGARIQGLHPWALLAWFLQGLERYWASGHTEFQVPEACKEWSGDLVREQDVARCWIEEHLFVAGPDEFVLLRDVEIKARTDTINLSRPALKKKIEKVFVGVTSVIFKREIRNLGERHLSPIMGLKWQ